MPRITLLVAMFLSGSVAAFDIDGLRSGMPRDKAIALLQDYGLKITSEKGDHVLATAVDRLYSLNFCKGSLVNVQKNLKPTFDAFVELAARFQSIYGAPVNIAPQVPDPTSYAPSHGLSISWRDKGELITVTYNSFSTNNQTYVTFDARNSCYQHPLLRQ